MKIAITTPTGNIGRKLVKILLDDNSHELILLARDSKKLSSEEARGARISVGDQSDSEFVKKATEGDVSVHGEFFSPFTQLLELFGYENALMALMTHPDTCKAILDRYSEGCIYCAGEQAKRDVDAILMSSAFAGAGFISRCQLHQCLRPDRDGFHHHRPQPGRPCHHRYRGGAGKEAQAAGLHRQADVRRRDEGD